MSERNVIVTGAGGGIGRATVKKFAEMHDNIFAVVHHISQDLTDEFEQLSLRYKVLIRIYEVDFLDENSVKKSFKEICRNQVDILINNAGKSSSNTLSLTSMNELNELMIINFFIPSLIIQIVSRRMARKKQGIIVNTISRCALEYRSGAYAYGASKAALLWATKALSKELAPYNIRVNGVAPGLTATKMGTLGRSEKSINDYVSINNIKRPALPEEIANVIFFLCETEASYVSGQIISVDGGRD